MVVSIHQPNYIPYLGIFYKAAKSDVFVLLDDAQYSNEGLHNSNYVKTPAGRTTLKIPVEQHLGDLINEVTVKDGLRWRKKHLKTIEMNYKRADYFNEVYWQFRELLETPSQNLSAINRSIIEWVINGFGLGCKVVMSSELGIKTMREERVLDIVSALGGDTYYSGNGASVYQIPEHFSERGIRLVYSDYHPTEYKQLWKNGFIPNLSVIDYIMNCGFDKSIFEK